MRTLAFEGIQVERERCNQRFALTGLHLGDVPAMERDTTEQLDVEVGLLQGPRAGLADRGEGLGQDVVERLPRGELLAE
jgi:hypothetical protein